MAPRDIATRRALLCHVEFDKADIASALQRQEIRARLSAMSEGERVNAITSHPQLREAAFEGPAMLSGFTEEMRADLKRRLIFEEHPEQAARLD